MSVIIKRNPSTPEMTNTPLLVNVGLDAVGLYRFSDGINQLTVFERPRATPTFHIHELSQKLFIEEHRLSPFDGEVVLSGVQPKTSTRHESSNGSVNSNVIVYENILVGERVPITKSTHRVVRVGVSSGVEGTILAWVIGDQNTAVVVGGTASDGEYPTLAVGNIIQPVDCYTFHGTVTLKTSVE